MSLEVRRAERLLTSASLFQGLDREVVRDLSLAATSRRLARGDRLWRTGDPATHFTCIVSGIFKIVRTAADGSEAIVALFGPRESIGDVAVLGARPYPAAAVLTSAEGEVLRVPAEPILASMREKSEVACTMNRTLVDHTQALQEKIRVMSAGGVAKRLATLILGLADRFGDDLEDGAILVPVALSRGELACLVGARVETTIRTIRQWEKSGIITTVADGFRLLDRDALMRKTTADATLDD